MSTTCYGFRFHTLGINGRAIVQLLSKNSDTWGAIYALSRSQKENYPSYVKHRHLDLMGSPEQLVDDLKGIEAEYLFFTAYLQKDSEQENWDVNGKT